MSAWSKEGVASVFGGCLTAEGAAGLAVFRVTGPGVSALLARIFRKSQLGNVSAPWLAHGHLMAGARVVDEVLVFVEEGEDAAEIAGHGGPATRRAIEALLLAEGVTLLGQDAILARDLSGEPGRSILAEAYDRLSLASCAEAVSFFLRAIDGGLIRELSAVSAAAKRAGALPLALASRLESLVRRTAFGVAFSRPPSILLLGAPNAGKSSLMNRLLDDERCIVTAVPGTTRDLVRERLTLAGHPFEVVDSAGLRDTEDAVESAGVSRTLDASVRASLLVHVVDGTGPFLPLDGVARRADLIVVTRRDLFRDTGPSWTHTSRALCISVSSTTGEGIPRLKEELFARSPFAGPTHREMPCPFTERQRALLEIALRSAREGDLVKVASVVDDLLAGPIEPARWSTS